jgi:hypothetical protein
MMDFPTVSVISGMARKTLVFLGLPNNKTGLRWFNRPAVVVKRPGRTIFTVTIVESDGSACTAYEI